MKPAAGTSSRWLDRRTGTDASVSIQGCGRRPTSPESPESVALWQLIESSPAIGWYPPAGATPATAIVSFGNNSSQRQQLHSLLLVAVFLAFGLVIALLMGCVDRSYLQLLLCNNCWQHCSCRRNCLPTFKITN